MEWKGGRYLTRGWPARRIGTVAGILGVAVAFWACHDEPTTTRAVIPRAFGNGPLLDLNAAYHSGAPYEIRSTLTANRCIGVEGASVNNGTALVLWTCTDETNQRYSWMPSGEIRVYDGTADVMCVDNSGGNVVNGNPIVAFDCGGAASQNWEITPDAKGFRLVGSNMCIAVPGANSSLGTHLVLWQCDGSAAQQWALGATGVGGSCGASFTAISTQQDDLLAQYDYPEASDTVQICETWTGSDYTWNAHTTGTTEAYQTGHDAGAGYQV